MRNTLIVVVLILLLFASCAKQKEMNSITNLDIYAGNVAGVDQDGYVHAIEALCAEMERHPELFYGTIVRVIRYGDRNTVKAAPVLKVKMPDQPDCRVSGQIWKRGKSKRDEQCQEKKDAVAKDFEDRIKEIRQALETAPQSDECVSYKNLLTRLRFEPERPPSIVITDVSHACYKSEDQLEPLKRGSTPLIVVQLATESDFTERNKFIERILAPAIIVPGTSAEQAIKSLRTMQESVARR